MYEALDAIQDAEIVVYEKGLITKAAHQQIHRGLIVAFNAELGYLDAVDAWPKDQGAEAQVRVIVKELKDLVPVVASGVTDPTKRSEIIALVNSALAVADNMLVILKAVK